MSDLILYTSDLDLAKCVLQGVRQSWPHAEGGTPSLLVPLSSAGLE